MARSLDEIDGLRRTHNAPVVCAGDVFDRWNSPPELINFALDKLPAMSAVPGQHDLPLHRLDLAHRSAYGTLCRTGKIATFSPGCACKVAEGVWVQGFPWGVPLIPCPDHLRKKEGLKIAAVHSFVWLNEDTSYPGAPQSGKVSASRAAFDGWDAVVYGDNHKGFLTEVDDTAILNCGTVFRRTVAEVDYRPHVGLLRASSFIDVHYLDVSKDVLVVPPKEAKVAPESGLVDFVGALQSLAGDPLDFEGAMSKAMRACKDPGVRDILTEIMA